MPDGATVQVVTLDDAASLASSAAAQAVEGERESATDSLRGVVDVAAEESVSRLLESERVMLEEVAASAAEQATEDVRAELSTVTLDAEQWAWLQDSARIRSTCSVLSLLVLCLAVGVMLSRFFVDGWRR